MLSKSKSRYPTIVIRRTNCTDDTALICNRFEQAEILFPREETAAKQTGLHIKNTKTEFIICNYEKCDLMTVNGQQLRCVDDSLYVGLWIDSCKK